MGFHGTYHKTIIAFIALFILILASPVMAAGKFDDAPTDGLASGLLLGGDWETYSTPPAISKIDETSTSKTIIWGYTRPEAKEEIVAGISLFVKNVSVKGKRVAIDMNAAEGLPLTIRFLSFVPGLSREGENDSYVPVEGVIEILSGSHEIVLEPEFMPVPNWWSQGSMRTKFNPLDVRIIQFEVQFDKETGSVADTIKFKKITVY